MPWKRAWSQILKTTFLRNLMHRPPKRSSSKLSKTMLKILLSKISLYPMSNQRLEEAWRLVPFWLRLLFPVLKNWIRRRRKKMEHQARNLEQIRPISISKLYMTNFTKLQKMWKTCCYQMSILTRNQMLLLQKRRFKSKISLAWSIPRWSP